jgi:hypothetical protein
VKRLTAMSLGIATWKAVGIMVEAESTVVVHYRYVWSAAELQAENRDDGLVCANVFGLWWSPRLLAMMESARSLPI